MGECPQTAAVSMTVDPDGAMHDWMELPAPWEVLPIPTQEIVHLIGVDGYQELLVDVATHERPSILMTHPPYDYLRATTAEAIRALGTRLVGYAFDDEIFAPQGGAARRFGETIYDRYVSTKEVRWATRALPALSLGPGEHHLVLVGRAYPRRVALVDELRRRGYRITVRGLGWAGQDETWVDRDEMLRLYSRSLAVLNTADWEDLDVRMVKHRVIETAMLGVFQIVERTPDLRRYFGSDELATYRDADELQAQLERWLPDSESRRQTAQRARQRCLAEHTWHTRWPELIAPLALAPAPTKTGRSALLDQLYATLAARAEATGRSGAAHALWSLLRRRQPANRTAQAGVARTLFQLGRVADAIAAFESLVSDEPAVSASFLDGKVDAHGIGTAMGAHGMWPPNAENLALLVAAYVGAGRHDDAAQLLDSVTDAAARRSLALALTVTEPSPALAAALARLTATR